MHGARCIAAVTLGLLLARGATAADNAFDPARAVVLAPDKAIDLTHTCSRKSPGPVDGTWMPQPEQIRELEAGLGQIFYDAAKAEGARLNATAYTRQYGGLMIAGREVIYVNASMLMGDPPDDASPLVRKRLNWRENAQSVCDDGYSSFGVEFDVETHTFRNFEFDGCMCVRVKGEGAKP